MQETVSGPASQPWEQKILEKTLMANVIEQRRARRWGIFWKVLFFSYILFLTYMVVQGKPQNILKDHVALIDLNGTIGTGKEVEADHVATSLRKAFDEQKVKGIILRINSPGGTPVQSAYIYDELRRLRKKHPEKKVYAVAVDICASGAYFVAAGADQIYANGSSIIGSIGVLMPGFGAVEAMKKLGVENRSLAAGKNKAFLDPFAPQNPEQEAYAKTLLDNVHQQFIKAVKEGRGARLKSTSDDVFSGLIWTGEKALEIGLIDGLGSAGFVAREVIGVDEIIDYTVNHTFFDKLATKFGASFSKQLSSELGLTTATLR